MEWNYTDSSVKKKVPGTTVSKEGNAHSLLGDERLIIINFLQKSASY